MKTNKIIKNNAPIVFFMLPFLMGINIDLYVPSLPKIATYFHTTSFLTQLTISSYMLSYSFSQIILGMISDIVGRRKILLYCSISYVISCLLSIFAPNIYILVFSRFLQGFFIGGLSVAIRAAASDSFTGVSLAKVVNNISIGWSLGPIIAPLIGGYLQYYFSWQADFVFLLAYGLFSLFLIYFLLPETKSKCNIIKKHELLYNLKTVLSDSTFMFYSTIGSLVYAILVIFNIIGPFLLENVLQISVVCYGRIALIMGCAYCFGTLMNRYAINHFKPIQIAQTSIVISLAICILAIIIAMSHNLSLATVILPLIILFILCGFVIPNIMGKFASMFKSIAGTASAASGSIVVAGVFIMSIIAASLKSKTQLPMMILYTAMILSCLFMVLICRKKENKAEAPSQVRAIS